MFLYWLWYVGVELAPLWQAMRHLWCFVCAYLRHSRIIRRVRSVLRQNRRALCTVRNFVTQNRRIVFKVLAFVWILYVIQKGEISISDFLTGYSINKLSE